MAGFINETLEKHEKKYVKNPEEINKKLRSSLSALIKSTDFKKTYFLYGDETYLIRYYKNQLINAIIGDNELNLNVFDGPKFDRVEFLDVARTLPFFSEKRVVVLENTGLFKAKPKKPEDNENKNSNDEDNGYNESGSNEADFDDEEESLLALDELFEDIPDTTVLIIVDKKITKTLKVVKNLLKNGEAYEIGYQDEQFIKTWLTKKIKDAGKLITIPAMDLLLEQIGFDMNTLIGEADKLITYSNKDIIDEKDVEAITSDRFENRVFKMIECAVTGRMSEALDLYKDVLALKAEPIAVLVLMGKQISKYLAALEVYNQTRNSWTVKEKTGVIYFEKVVRFCNKEKLEGALEKYIDLDRSIKEGNLDMKIAPELLIAYLAKQC